MNVMLRSVFCKHLTIFHRQRMCPMSHHLQRIACLLPHSHEGGHLTAQIHCLSLLCSEPLRLTFYRLNPTDSLTLEPSFVFGPCRALTGDQGQRRGRRWELSLPSFRLYWVMTWHHCSLLCKIAAKFTGHLVCWGLRSHSGCRTFSTKLGQSWASQDESVTLRFIPLPQMQLLLHH